jgi:hypothetical protein
MTQEDDGRFGSADRAADASHSSPQAVSTIGGIPSADDIDPPTRADIYRRTKPAIMGNYIDDSRN